MQPVVLNNTQMQGQQPGQGLSTGALLTTYNTSANGTLTGAMLAGGFINRLGPTADFVDTFPTADQFLAAIANFSYPTGIPVAGVPTGYGNGVQVGAVYDFTYRNTVAYNMTTTSTANSGVTISANNAALASTMRQYAIRIDNATPPQTFTGSGASGQKVVTGFSASQTALLQPGMLVSGTGVTSGSLITSVQQGVGVTLDTNLAGTITSGQIVFVPRITVQGKFTAAL